jgi:hypothetical protein
MNANTFPRMQALAAEHRADVDAREQQVLGGDVVEHRARLCRHEQTLARADNQRIVHVD